MSIKFLLLLLLCLVVAVFSVQNAGVVRLRFFAWDFDASQAIVIFISAFIGAAIGAVYSALLLRKRKVKAPPAQEPPPH